MVIRLTNGSSGRAPLNLIVRRPPMRALTVVNILVWGGFTLLGIDLTNGVTAQHIAGYPNSGQIAYYIRFPLAMAACATAAYLLARFTRFKGCALSIQILVLLVFFPFFLAYTGGV